jgi:hypothetical protein
MFSALGFNREYLDHKNKRFIQPLNSLEIHYGQTPLSTRVVSIADKPSLMSTFSGMSIWEQTALDQENFN